MRAKLIALSLLSLFGSAAFGAPDKDAVAALQALGEAEPMALEPARLLLAAQAVPEARRSDVVVLWSATDYAINAAGAVVRRDHLIYRVPKADDLESWAVVSISWAPWHQERPALRARVVTLDGVVHVLDPSTMAERPVQAEADDLFTDERVLEAPLPALAAGAVVEEVHERRDVAPLFPAGTTERLELGYAPRVEGGRVRVEAPASLSLRWSSHGTPRLEPQASVAGATQRLEFRYGPIEEPKDVEGDLPNELEPWTGLEFSTGTSWAAVADGYAEVVTARLAAHDLSRWLRSLPKAAPSADRVAQVLAKLHQEVRYTGIEFGAASIVPTMPSETVKRGFGDCKDQATLLVAALAESGITAHVALLRAGFGRDVAPELPGLGAFNHAIVVVAGDPELWIDPTDPYSRAGQLPRGDQGRQALIVRPGSDRLVRTPESSSADNRLLRTRDVTLAEWGKGRIVETAEYSGALESEARRSYDGVSDDNLRKRFEGYVKSQFLGAKVERFSVGSPREVGKPYAIRVETSDNKRTVTNERQAMVAALPAELATFLPWGLRSKADPEKPRRGDFEITQPVTVEYRYHVVGPPGFKAGTLPGREEQSLGAVSWSQDYSVEADGSIAARWKLTCARARLSADEFTKLQAAVKKLAETPAVLLTFDEEGVLHLASGAVRAALGDFGKLVALHPSEGLHRSQYALALLSGGLGEEARREAAKAVALDAKSAFAQRTLGWCLQHDVLGRRFAPGFDRSAAIRAYDSAIALDPKDAIAAADLAILLEHDEHGVRYGSKDGVERAIGIYRKVRTDLEEHGFDDNLAIALLQAGRYDEAQELLVSLAESPARKQLRVDLLVLLKGAEAGVEEVRRSAVDASQRQRQLAGAAQDLLRLRRYAESAVLMRASAADAEEPSMPLAFADALAHMRPIGPYDAASSDPEEVVRGIFRMAFSDGDAGGLKKLLPTSAPRWLDMSQDDTTGLPRLAGLHRVLDRLGLPPDVRTDLLVGSMRSQREGDAKTGYRIRLSSNLGSSAERFVVFASPQGSSFRLAGAAGALGLAGVAVLEALEQGDLEYARHWLDWVWDETTEEGSSIRKLWSRSAKTEAARIRLVGLVLLAEAGPSDEALTTLAQLRADLHDDDGTVVDRALARAYVLRNRFDDAVEPAHRVMLHDSALDAAFRLDAEVLGRAKRWDELSLLARGRLVGRVGDPDATRVLAQVAMHTGNVAEAMRLLGELDRAGKASEMDFNNLAWLTLFVESSTDDALSWAQRATRTQSAASAAALHTAATVYARSGKTGEALKFLAQSIDSTASNTPQSLDWLVIGLVAEAYGLPDVARQYFQRVGSPAGDPVAPGALAAQRLTALGK